jgi:hypothetical protein
MKSFSYPTKAPRMVTGARIFLALAEAFDFEFTLWFRDNFPINSDKFPSGRIAAVEWQLVLLDFPRC